LITEYKEGKEMISTKKMFSLVSLFMAFTLIVLTPVFAETKNHLNEIPEDIEYFAHNEGLKLFIHFVSEDPAGYSFENDNELINVTLGPGYRLYGVKEDILYDQSVTDLSKLSYATNIFEFIVYSNGTPKSFLTVSKDQDGVFLRSAGKVATGIEKVLDTLDKLQAENKAAQREILVVQYGNDVKYFVLRSGDKEYIVPFTPVLHSKVDINGTVWKSSEVIDHIRTENNKYKNGEPGLVGSIGLPVPIKSEVNYLLIGSTSLGIALIVSLLISIVVKRKQNR